MLRRRRPDAEAAAEHVAEGPAQADVDTSAAAAPVAHTATSVARPMPFAAAAVDPARPLPRPRPVIAAPAAVELDTPTAARRRRRGALAGRTAHRAAAGVGAGFAVLGSGALRIGSGAYRAGAGASAVVARHPKAGQRTAFTALGGGIAAFVITAATGQAGSITAAPAQHHKAAHHKATTVTAMPAGPAPAAPAVPATQQILQRTPGQSDKPAPVNHGVISKLAANGIPAVALNAYRVAAARMANVEPSCGIPWYLLAGIGREESDHGRFHGAVLHADGVSTPKIIGPALDGKTWDYIPAPGNGLALDGDAKYAHALGPMQFIPSTWAVYGADANGDGKADIFNINDAALGAARYLCAAGGDLRTVAGRTRAVLTYNHNDQYLAQVLALADAYHKGIPVTGVPVGITTGTLPTLVDTGYIPPANPATPTAVDKTKGKKHPGKSKPKPTKSGSSTSPHPGSSGSTSPHPGGGSSGSSPTGTPTSGAPTSGKPGGSGTAKPTPTPTPSPTCGLWVILGCKG